MKRKKRVGVKKRSTKTPTIVKVSLVIIVFFVLFATIFKITELIITGKKDTFPKLEISLKEVPIEQIDAGTKDIKYPDNTITLTTDDHSTTYENVEIKGRGNYTWTQIKKPYQIKFSEKTNLFNYGEARKWVFLADFADPAHLRNDVAFFISELFQNPYTPQGSYVELYTNGQYHGLYFLTEKIEINKSRVDLDDPFGIIVELDNLYGGELGCNYDNDQKNCFILKDSVNLDNEDISMENFLYTFNSLKTAIKHKDWKKIQEYIDIDSFAKYYLLSEFTVNPDAYSTSFYMYKNGEKDKIHAGPVWDFDSALGNKSWAPEGIDKNKLHSPFETMNLRNYLNKTDTISHAVSISTIIYDLMKIPEFQTRVKEIYQETLSGHDEELLDYIQSQAEYIRPAVLRDQERWKLKANFDDEVEYLIDWVAKRYDHFEQTYGPDSPPID